MNKWLPTKGVVYSCLKKFVMYLCLSLVESEKWKICECIDSWGWQAAPWLLFREVKYMLPFCFSNNCSCSLYCQLFLLFFMSPKHYLYVLQLMPGMLSFFCLPAYDSLFFSGPPLIGNNCFPCLYACNPYSFFFFIIFQVSSKPYY